MKTILLLINVTLLILFTSCSHEASEIKDSLCYSREPYPHDMILRSGDEKMKIFRDYGYGNLSAFAYLGYDLSKMEEDYQFSFCGIPLRTMSKHDFDGQNLLIAEYFLKHGTCVLPKAIHKLEYSSKSDDIIEGSCFVSTSYGMQFRLIFEIEKKGKKYIIKRLSIPRKNHKHWNDAYDLMLLDRIAPEK